MKDFPFVYVELHLICMGLMIELAKIILNPDLVFQSASYLSVPHSFVSSTNLISIPSAPHLGL